MHVASTYRLERRLRVLLLAAEKGEREEQQHQHNEDNGR